MNSLQVAVFLRKGVVEKTDIYVIKNVFWVSKSLRKIR